jgi:hypothetical protein
MRQHIKELAASKPAPPTPTPPSKEPARQPEPKPTPERPPDKTATYIGWGLVALGGVLGVTGGGFLIDAKSKSDSVQSIAPSTKTSWASDDARGTYDAAKRSQTIGIVCLAAAPVIVIAGVVTLLRAGR